MKEFFDKSEILFNSKFRQLVNPKKSNQVSNAKVKNSLLKQSPLEPVIGHLNLDHKLGRNLYKEVMGDNINIMLAAYTFNMKRVMTLIGSSFFGHNGKISSLAQKILESIFCLNFRAATRF